VNGRTNGKVNGLTNGRTNGVRGDSQPKNGLVNGVTNGTRIGRRLGRVNGITNGFVNGSGAVNGFRLSYQHRRFIERRPGNMRKKLIGIAIVAFLAATIPYALLNDFPPNAATIDGYFQEWRTAQMYKDTPDSPNPDISLTAYAMKHDRSATYFYIETQGQMFAGRDSGADGFNIFIDRDNNSNSGYYVRGIGADAMVSLIGWNNSLFVNETRVFNSTATRNDFAGFEYYSDAGVAFRNNKMEVSTPVIVNDLSRVVMVSRHTNMSNDFSDVNFRAKGAALHVIEDHDAPDVIVGYGDRHVLSIDISGKGATGSVRGFEFDIIGNATPTYIKALDGQTILGVTDGSSLHLVQPLKIADGERKAIDIIATFPFGFTNSSFGLRLNESKGLDVSGSATWSIDRQQSGSMVSYIGSPPSQIVIDGAFADWSTRVPIVDGVGDAYSERTNDYKSGDVDLSTVKIASTQDVASFYMAVNGTMLGGTSVPASLVRVVRPGPPAENVTEITEPMYGADFAFVFIDTDSNQSTGFSVGGSETAIAVLGKGNSIMLSKAYKYVGDGWMDIGSVQAAVDKYQLEVSGNYSQLGLVQGQVYTVTFMAQDWSGRSDEIALALPARISAGTRAFGGIMINEAYNQAKKPHDWIELYNTGTTPINIGGYEIWVDGVGVYTFPSATLLPGEFFVADGLNFGSLANSFVLYNSLGSIADTMQVPNWDGSNAWGRIGSPPYGSISNMGPSPGKINKGQVAIPEFGDLLLPISIMPFMLFVIRRSKRPRKQEKG
jgi:hypothetical protein